MIPYKLYFDFRDLLSSPRISLSGKKIWIFIIGNLIGFSSYWSLTYISFFVSNYDFYKTLNTYGLYPYLFGNTASWISWLIYSLGIIIWISILILSATAVSRITLNQLKGNHFFSNYDAWKYSYKYWKSIIFTPITLIFIILFFILIAFFFSLLSSITFIGSFIYASLFPLYFLGSIFTIYTVFVLIISLIYTPSIIAVYEEDVMGTIFQSYSICWSQPWRVIVYITTLFFLMILGFQIFSFICFNAYNLIFFIFKYTMGESLIKITNFSLNIISTNFPFENIFTSKLLFNNSINNSFNSNFESISLNETLSSVILSMFLFIIGLSMISYPLSIFFVGNTISFIIFKKKTDDDDILKRINEDEEKMEEDDFKFNDEKSTFIDDDKIQKV